MGDPRAFLRVAKKTEPERPKGERVEDFREVTLPLAKDDLIAQASRCMSCGIPFCHSPVSSLPERAPGGCPLGNLIPEWNDLVFRERFDDASARLLSTNNFPEITGRVCPAPCEASCVLAIDGAPVSIKAVERAIADRFASGLLPVPPRVRSGKKVAVVGSGPSGLAAAQELTREGHDVTVFERDDRIGGLLRYGIPDFKLEKEVLDRRIAQLVAEGVRFQTRTTVGETVSADDLEHEFHAVIVAVGARAPRDLVVPGRALAGIHFAMDYLTAQNRRVAGESIAPTVDRELHAEGKHVVVIGGGDTGSDCVGTALRQGAASVVQLELLPRPPDTRPTGNGWPDWPFVLRTSSSHAEGGERDWAVRTRAFQGDARVAHLEVERVQAGGIAPSEPFRLSCDLALLALGFTGPEAGVAQLFGLSCDARGNVITAETGATNRTGVFAAGDASRGQSLVVWAIADGRRVARGVSVYLRTVASGTRSA